MARWHFEHWDDMGCLTGIPPSMWLIRTLIQEGHKVSWEDPDWMNCDVLVVSRALDEDHLTGFIERFPNCVALAWPGAWEQ